MITQGGILDTYGGEYEFDRWTVKLHKQRGYDRGVAIRYGKNMTSLTQDQSCEAVYTGVYPFWADVDGNIVQLDDRIVSAPGSYGFTRIYPLDLSAEWEDEPTKDQLKARAERYIKDNNIGVPKVSLSVAFYPLDQSEDYQGIAMLEQVGPCDTVTVEFPRLGVSAVAECVGIKYDVLSERYDELEIGDARTTLADTIVAQGQEIQQRPSDSTMRAAVMQLTAAILGASGGAVRLLDTNNDGMPDELYIADNDDPAKAKKVWRWNYAGWGASSNGYNGPFTLGATLEGGIVADFITTGTLNASLIRAGVLTDDRGKNFWNMETGEFSTSGTISSYDSPDGTLSGYLGYMTGATESGTTSGIGVGNASGDCYAIATGSGIRLQAGDYSVYVTKTGVAKLTGKAGSVLITSSGDKGAGVYITGRLFRRGSEGDEWTNIS